MIVKRVVFSDDHTDERTRRQSLEEVSTQQITIFTELLGDVVLEHYAEDGVRGVHCIPTSTLNGKVIGLYFS